MNWKDEDLPALRELESCIVQVWAAHEEMNDYTAGRAFHAAYHFYRTVFRGGVPTPPVLKGVDKDTFDAVQGACEKLLKIGPAPYKGMAKVELKPITAERLVDYLRELERSVERHTELGGRHGYLEFVRSYFS